MTQQIGQYTHHISDHVHFFHPRCGDACVCSANALEEFTESELRTVPQGLSLSLPPPAYPLPTCTHAYRLHNCCLSAMRFPRFNYYINL